MPVPEGLTILPVNETLETLRTWADILERRAVSAFSSAGITASIRHQRRKPKLL